MSVVWWTHRSDLRLKSGWVRPLQHTAQGHDGGIPVLPVTIDKVFSDKGYHMLHNLVLTTAGHEREAHPCCLARDPVILIIILFLEVM